MGWRRPCTCHVAHVPWTLHTHAPGPAAAAAPASFVPARKGRGADGLGCWAGLGGIAFQLTLLNLPPGAAPDRYQDGISAPAAVKLQASMLLPAWASASPSASGPHSTRQAGHVHRLMRASTRALIEDEDGACRPELGDWPGRGACSQSQVGGARVGVTSSRQVRVRGQVQVLYMPSTIGHRPSTIDHRPSTHPKHAQAVPGEEARGGTGESGVRPSGRPSSRVPDERSDTPFAAVLFALVPLDSSYHT